MEIRKNILMTLEDYIQFNLFFSRKTRIALFFIFLFIFPLFYYIGNDNYDIISFVVSVLVSLVLSALIMLLNSLLFKRTAKKHYDSSPMMRTENKLLINDSGISESSRFGSTSVEWQDIYKVEESINAVYLYIAKIQAFIVPKRLLTAEEHTVLYTLIKKHLAPDKYRFLKGSQSGDGTELQG